MRSNLLFPKLEPWKKFEKDLIFETILVVES